MSELTNPETTSFLERVVRDPAIDVVKLEQIIALQERVAAREAKRQFAEAMNALQAEMPQITKDAVNPHVRSRYATFESIDAVLRPLYTKHGFSVRFTTHAENNRIRVGCTVSHVGGHSETAHELESGPDLTGSRGQANKTEVQGVGSIVSYLKRYTMMAAFAVALQDDPDEDDGETRLAAPARNPPPPRPARTNGADDRPDPWQIWVDQFESAAKGVHDAEAAHALLGRPSVGKNYTAMPHGPQRQRFLKLYNDIVAAWLPKPEPEPPAGPLEDWPDDPIRELCAEVDGMDLITIAGLITDARWRAKLHELLPPDVDRLNEYIDQHKARLQAQRA